MAGVALRAMKPSDEPFLREVYAQSREREMALLDWTPEAKREFLDWQFDAQHAHYQEHYPDARFDVIEREGAPIGRLYVARSAAELRVIDIALLREQRGRGVGRALIEDLQREASRSDCALRLHVEPDNPARALYTRLGFRELGDEGAYLHLQWRPTT